MSKQGRMVPHIVVCLLLASALIGCGRKTDPLTPDSPRPEAVRDLNATVRDTIAYLSWTLPTKNIEGKPMDPGEMRGFRVYRAELDRGDRRPRFRQIGEILMENPALATVRGASVVWADKDLQYGRAYVYRIRADSQKGGTSDYSNEARVVPLPSLSPPRTVRAQAGDGAVALSWDTVITRTSGEAVQGYIGYNIYRGTEAGKIDDVPINREPLVANTYQDTAVENGKAYYYRVRAVDRPGTPWRESLDSEEAAAQPRDLTPPEPPQGLTVIPGIGRVFLTWNENRERDLAGYRVYRSGKKGGEAELLTESPIRRTTYSDETVRPGMTYYYSLSAVDRSGNESARSREIKTSTEKTR